GLRCARRASCGRRAVRCGLQRGPTRGRRLPPAGRSRRAPRAVGRPALVPRGEEAAVEPSTCHTRRPVGVVRADPNGGKGDTMTEHTRVVVIGGGYAGVMAANRLTRRDDVTVTLVNPRPTFVERIRLHQLVTGSHPAVVDYRDIL